jgi:hypothetical protein
LLVFCFWGRVSLILHKLMIFLSQFPN